LHLSGEIPTSIFDLHALASVSVGGNPKLAINDLVREIGLIHTSSSSAMTSVTHAFAVLRVRGSISRGSSSSGICAKKLRKQWSAGVVFVLVAFVTALC
jgi:hypothetical protein